MYQLSVVWNPTSNTLGYETNLIENIDQADCNVFLKEEKEHHHFSPDN